MLKIKTLDVEINKDGNSYLVSNNNITGTSLEVLSFMASGIKKRSGSGTSEGRPGRINYYSEDDYRTITMTVEATAEDMQDVAHLRDSVNELFDGEMFIREMRIKEIKVEYESPGQRTGELQLDSPEYVNGKQIKVAQVNNIEIDDTTLRSIFTVEFETVELPYFESIYTTLELHDSSFAHSAEKYGLVDNIDDEKVKYRFKPNYVYKNLTSNQFENGSIFLSNGQNADSNIQLGRTKEHYPVTRLQTYELKLDETGGTINYIRIFHYDSNGNHIGNEGTANVNGNGSTSYEFTAQGTSIRLLLYAASASQVNVSGIGTKTKISIGGYGTTSNFNVYNAGNVAVEPESMFLNIFSAWTVGDSITITNNSTNESFTLNRKMSGRNIQVNGMIVLDGSAQVFRDTNKRFISLKPGDNSITVTGAIFNELRFNFKYYYK